MIVIGLTGILGSGKSTVADLLRKRGLAVIDLDQLAKDSLNWTDTRQDIKATFGDLFVVEDRVDVERLGRIAFGDLEAKRKLESIIHPRVEKKVEELLVELKALKFKAVVIDHPLLFEVGLRSGIDKKVVVTAKMETIRERVKKRGMAVDDMERRFSFQIPLEEKERMADYVIDNNGTTDRLGEQVDGLLEKITKWEESRTCI
jgi:dephospho-CoA kinase